MSLLNQDLSISSLLKTYFQITDIPLLHKIIKYLLSIISKYENQSNGLTLSDLTKPPYPTNDHSSYTTFAINDFVDKDIEDYQRALRDHRITWEDDGRFYHYPHLGDHYFEIFFENGRATFAERSFDSEDERPPISRLIMECDLSVNQELREKRVRRRVRDINEALGLKENNK